jgi:RNA polymerase sigma-70 factor, ECF subfamily
VTALKEKFLLFRIRTFQDREAFKELMEEHGSKLNRFLLLKLPRKQDAEDVFNETYWRIWSYISRTEIESLSGLIFTIARASVAEFYRKRKMTVSINASPVIENKIYSKQGGDQIMASMDVKILTEALEKLPDEKKQAVVMRYYEGHSIRTIAKTLGKTEGAATVFIHRAVKDIRSFFEDKEV